MISDKLEMTTAVLDVRPMLRGSEKAVVERVLEREAGVGRRLSRQAELEGHSGPAGEPSASSMSREARNDRTPSARGLPST